MSRAVGVGLGAACAIGAAGLLYGALLPSAMSDVALGAIIGLTILGLPMVAGVAGGYPGDASRTAVWIALLPGSLALRICVYLGPFLL